MFADVCLLAPNSRISLVEGSSGPVGGGPPWGTLRPAVGRTGFDTLDSLGGFVLGGRPIDFGMLTSV
jgi:hypothetical protein